MKSDCSKRIDQAVEAFVLPNEYPDIQDQREMVAYYKLQRKAERYAKKFFRILIADDLITEDVIPLVFQDKLASIYYKGSTSGGTFGFNKYYDRQAAIYIDLPRQQKAVLSKSLKQYIRHELIHYYLWLRGLPYEDNAALFWAYCLIYDAKAYAALPEVESNKYDRFVSYYKKADPSTRFRELQRTADKMIIDPTD